MISLAAGTTGTILATVAAFLLITLLLVALLLFVKQKLSPSGPVTITINGEKKIEVSSGSTLLTTLGNEKIFLPSACGGGGSCVQCECHVNSGGGEALPTETPHFSRKELKHGIRLACQVKVKQDMDISIPEEVFGIKKWEATVVRNYNVASFIKEFVVEIPEDMGYKAGGYIQIEIPNCEIKFSDIDITAHPEEHETPDKFQAEWDKFGLWPLVMKNNETVERAYSMASYPAEGREIMLNVPKKDAKLITDPLTDNNPITIQVLGICSALAITAELQASIVMSVSVLFVLGLGNVVISLMRNIIPSKIRIIVQLIVVATLVIIVDLVLKAFAYELSKTLSVFVGLIITNCIIMGRFEAFALGNGPWKSFLDGIGNSLGYAVILIIVGFFRELLGSGTLLGIQVLGDPIEKTGLYSIGYENNGFMLLSPMALIVVGLIIWVQRSRNQALIEEN